MTDAEKAAEALRQAASDPDHSLHHLTLAVKDGIPGVQPNVAEREEQE